MHEPILILDAKAKLGEGAIWDCDKKLLYWIDIIDGEVHIFKPKTMQDEIIGTGEMIGTVVPCRTAGLVVAIESGLYFMNDITKKLSFINNPEKHVTGNRFNDGKCDPIGRFWVGTMSKTDESGTGSLYCLDKNLNVRTMLQGVSISNGIAWSTDNKNMYYIDTPTRAIWSFDYDMETGNISNKQAVITINESEGYPDGMTIDEQGMLWIAHWGGWKVSRWNPRNGEKLDEIKLPVEQVTSCAFGGENLDELYITTARTGLSDDKMFKQPYAGGLFCVKTNVKGLQSFKFNG